MCRLSSTKRPTPTVVFSVYVAVTAAAVSSVIIGHWALWQIQQLTSSVENFSVLGRNSPVTFPGNSPVTFPGNVCTEAKQDFRSASGVFCIVTGMEHSGTTILSALINSAPNLFSAFESGLLLASTPSQFKDMHPFFEWMSFNYLPELNVTLWGLTNQQRESLLNATCHAEQYIQLKQHSPLFQYPNNGSWIVDKTPGYIYNLVEVMDRTPGVPVIVSEKSDADQIISWTKRRQTQARINRMINKKRKSIAQAKEKYPNRVFVVNYTNLVENTDGVMEDVYAFLGLQWNPEYKTMQAYNAKMEAVGGLPAKAFYPTFSKNKAETKD